MAKEQKIYTKTGDDGTTGLVGGSRVKKNDIRLEAYGTIDELNASLGALRSFAQNQEVEELIILIQNKLFNIGSLLASDKEGKKYTEDLTISGEDILYLEKTIDKFEQSLPELKQFIIPGGDKSSALCHVARTICRRAERRILDFAEYEEVQPEIIQYINRLSDLLFVLSRKLNFDNNTPELNWNKK